MRWPDATLRVAGCSPERERDEVVFLEGCRGAGVAVGPHLRALERVGIRTGWADVCGMRDRAQLRQGQTTVSGPGSAGRVGSHACGSLMLTCRAWQLPAGIAAIVATMSASCGAGGAAVLICGCLTVPTVGDEEVLVIEEPHPASATPTTAMMVGTARRIMFTVLGLGFGGDPIALQPNSS